MRLRHTVWSEGHGKRVSGYGPPARDFTRAMMDLMHHPSGRGECGGRTGRTVVRGAASVGATARRSGHPKLAE